MRLLLIFMIIAIAAYVGAFFKTHDPLVAVVASGIVSFVYIIILIFITTKPPFPAKLRYLALSITIITYGSLTAPFIEGHNTGHFQRSELVAVRNVIGYGISMDVMIRHSITTLQAYHDPRRPSHETFVNVFDRLNPRWEAGSNVLEDSVVWVWKYQKKPPVDSVQVYVTVSCVGDSEVILRGVDVLPIREDSIRRVLNISVQNVTPVVHLSAKGVSYEYEQ